LREAVLAAARVLVRQVDDAAAEALPGVSLRCLAYALPLGLLGWTLIYVSIAFAAGYLKF
jgi:hypothetical protein